MVDRTRVTEHPSAAGAVSTSDLVDRLSRFDGPPESFLANLLAVQCYLAAAGGGAILRLSPENKVEVLAIYPALPQGQTAPVWLAQSVEYVAGVLSSGVTSIRPLAAPDDLYGAPPRQHLVMIPIRGSSAVRGAACFLIETGDAATLAVCRERLELTVSLLSLYEMRLTLQRRQTDMGRLRLALDVLSALNEHDRFAGSAMALCNELSSRLQCERVSLGFLKGRYVHMRAQSHTEKFSRKMKVVQDIEAAMEECLDQDVEVVYPCSPEVTYVSRSTKELATRHGPSAVISLPLRRSGEVAAVLTVERSVDRPFTLEEAESLRLTCDLCTARLVNLHEHDRWFGARAAGAARKAVAVLVGPKHTWAKLTGLAITAFILFALFVKGDYQAEATFALEATDQRALPAPFDGYIEAVYVEPGDRVAVAKEPRGEWADRTAYAAGDEVRLGDRFYGCIETHTGSGNALTRPDTDPAHWAPTVLAKLETKDLEKQLVEAKSDLGAARSEESKAKKDAQRDATKLAEAQIAHAKGAKAQAQIEQLQRRIHDAYIRSPMAGTMIPVKGEDLRQQIRRPLKTGDIMFYVASMDSVRAVLDVPEDQIVEVKVGDRGNLAAQGYPQDRIGFVVERINPVGEVVEQQNVFKVRASLDRRTPWMRPTIKGIAKIDLARKPYYQLWTRKLVNWVRMKLWI